jgi:hypothetical protein
VPELGASGSDMLGLDEVSGLDMNEVKALRRDLA